MARLLMRRAIFMRGIVISAFGSDILRKTGGTVAADARHSRRAEARQVVSSGPVLFRRLARGTVFFEVVARLRVGFAGVA